MNSVLHVGPVDTPGGMASVIRILHENPPDGWVSNTLSTHCNGSKVKKYLKWRRSFRLLKQILSNPQSCPNVVHIHCASDWSWWRKKRVLRLVEKGFRIPCIVHIHSGKFATWLDEKPKRGSQIKNALDSPLVITVVLSKYWNELLRDKIGDSMVANNPIDPKIHFQEAVSREGTIKILMLGRNDPVKGHTLAVGIFRKLRKGLPNLILNITGYEGKNEDGINSLGWVSEEDKIALLNNSNILIVPSKYEGQPMVIIEALACGLPVICSDNIPPTPNSVVRAKSNDLEDWVDKLGEVIKNPPSRKSIIADSQPHQLDNVRNNWLQIYSNALSK